MRNFFYKVFIYLFSLFFFFLLKKNSAREARWEVVKGQDSTCDLLKITAVHY